VRSPRDSRNTTSSIPPQDRNGGWAGLPGDLLTCVFQLLTVVPSRICFRAVCCSWRAAVVEDAVRIRMPPPWVVVPGDKGCSRSFTLLSIPTRQGFRWTPPGGAGLRCVGSNGGWLAGAYIDADRTVRIALVNPLMSARVEVPAIGRVSFLPHHERHKSKVEVALSALVKKVAFSLNPTEQSFAVAVVSVNRSRVPASFGIVFARAGCEGWCAYAKVADGREFPTRLDVAYHDGKFYYMDIYDRVCVVDMAAPSPSSVPLARFELAIPGCVYYNHDSFHLAFSSDGALHVVSSKSIISGDYYAPSNLDMFAQRYGLTHSSQGWSMWTSVTRLHGQCFLVGDYNQTLCVPVDGGEWLMPDSVYFTGIPMFLLRHGWYRAVRGLDSVVGVRQFNLDTGYIELKGGDLLTEKGSDRLSSGLDWSMAVWFMPSMR
jgi:hypothetical protein